MKAQSEIDRISKRYHASSATIARLVELGIQDGCTQRGALARVRYALGEEFDISETFASDEIAEMLQLPVNEVNQAVEANRTELMERSQIVSLDTRAVNLLKRLYGGTDYE